MAWQANKSVVRRKYPALEAFSAMPAHKQPELDPKFFRDLRQTEDIEVSSVSSMMAGPKSCVIKQSLVSRCWLGFGCGT